MTRELVFTAFGLVLLVAQAAFGVMWSASVWTPNLLLPIVVYLGVANDFHFLRGAVVAFILGYFMDVFCGSPMGLHTFVLVAVFLVVRGSGLNLVGRAPFIQILLTSALGLLSGGTILALRAIFEPRAPFAVDSTWTTALLLVPGALLTGLLSPLLFAATRRLHLLVGSRRDEAGAR